MRVKTTTGIMLATLLLVGALPIGVSVGVVDLDDGSVALMAESSVDWWSMFHHDPFHSGYTASTAPSTNNTIWNYTTGHFVISSPAVVDGKVYLGSWDNNVYCLNAATGAEIWNYTTGKLVIGSSPAVVDDRVYVGSLDKKIYALNASTGALVWNYTTGYWHVSSPTVVDGEVYVASGIGIYCLNATTGAKIWNYTTEDVTFYPPTNTVPSSPAVANSKIYIGSWDGKVYCLDASSGLHLWNYTTGSWVWSSPAVANERVYVGSFDNEIYCLDALTGAKIWNYTTGGFVQSSPAIAYGRVYVGSSDKNVYCLDASSGLHLWNYTTGSWVVSSPAVANERVYVGSEDEKVYCLNAITGAEMWSYTTGSYVESSPAIADGNVYVGSDDGRIYAFGDTRKQTTLFFNVNPNPASVGGTITLKGILLDAAFQPLLTETVRLYARSSVGSWQYVTALSTSGYGIFTWQATIPEVSTGAYILAVYYPGSETYESSYNFAILIIQ